MFLLQLAKRLLSAEFGRDDFTEAGERPTRRVGHTEIFFGAHQLQGQYQAGSTSLQAAVQGNHHQQQACRPHDYDDAKE